MSGDHLNKLQTTISLGSNTNHHQTTSSAIISSSSSSPSMPLSLNRYLRLNIGGRLFQTSLDTLTKQDNMLRAMFSGRLDVTTDSDGYILIDRCGKHFDLILDYLRDQDLTDLSIHLDAKNELELCEILKESKFYCIQPMISLIEQKLSNKSTNQLEPYFGNSIVSMITKKEDLTKILASTDKPCIRLLINRHNNKYSYTNTSDDNLLKNIELFERMAIKFKNRIMFIKDTTSSEEICCWYLYGGNKKLAEVCCTSIVYTTEKKQTKVEYPDSKILEDIFVNAVLFESNETSNMHHEEEQELELPRLINTQQAVTSPVTTNASNNNSSTSNQLSVSVSSLSLTSNPIQTIAIASTSSVSNNNTNNNNSNSAHSSTSNLRRLAR